MAHITHENTKISLLATTDDGDRIILNGDVAKKKEYYPVEELHERINLKNIFKAISEACKSSTDIVILGEILEKTDVDNDIDIPNLTKLAEELAVSRKHLNTVLKRAEEALLIYKINTGYYMVNPYKIMGVRACNAGFERQELNQVRWKELTGLLTDLELEQLIALNNGLKLAVPLRPTAFNLSVAKYYAKHGNITDKQTSAINKKE